MGTLLSGRNNIMKITKTMTAVAMELNREAQYHHEMSYKLACSYLTGKIDSQVVKYAEMIKSIYEKEKELWNT